MQNQIVLNMPRRSRGMLIGQSGAGKTTLGLALAQTMPRPLLVADTKYSAAIAEWGEHNDAIISDHFVVPRKDEIIIWRPSPDELANPDLLDAELDAVVRQHKICSIYIDELYQFHKSGRAGPGIIGLYTRGREMGFTTLAGSQRPSWVSAFCLTESDQFFVMRLTLPTDRKKIGEIMGAPQVIATELPPRWLWHAKAGEDPVLIKPLKLGHEKTLDKPENTTHSITNGGNPYILL